MSQRHERMVVLTGKLAQGWCTVSELAKSIGIPAEGSGAKTAVRLADELPLPVTVEPDPNDGRAKRRRLDPAETLIRLGGNALSPVQQATLRAVAQGDPNLSVSDLVAQLAQAFVFAQEAGIDLEVEEFTDGER